MQITWESFTVYNQDARGVRFKFEDLCRQIFIKEFLANNKRHNYLHSNPNNHGIECKPIYDEINQRWIGFQAKHFDNQVDYKQIMHSAKETIKYYTGAEGIVNHVYLFSNKQITSTSKQYKDIVKILNDNNITIELITDTAILDLVRQKYSYLGLYYFGNHSISSEWLKLHNEQMYDILGDRFSPDFHIDTETTRALSLFVYDQEAIRYINSKKTEMLDRIEQFYTFTEEQQQFLTILKREVEQLPDVENESILDSLKWYEKVEESIAVFVDDLELKCQELETKLYKEDDPQKVGMIRCDIKRLKELITIPECLIIDNYERTLLQSKVVLVSGKAGTGKSQLLAHESFVLENEERSSLLLVSGIYLARDMIQKQIVNNLNLTFCFDELIDVLNALGERHNCIIPIFIDALNETWYKELWRNELSSIVEKVSKTTSVKLVLSYRAEYERIVLPESIINKRREMSIPVIVQKGFEENSFEAVGKFLDHYNIPFSPTDYFNIQMTNPLFLKLYCKVYNGDNYNLPTLYEKVTETVSHKMVNTYKNIAKLSEYIGGQNILMPLIIEISSFFVQHNKKVITRAELENLDYWSKYGFSAPSVIQVLIYEDIFHTFVMGDEELYYFAFDQMNDYFCSKAIFQQCLEKDKNQIRKYLSDEVLGITEGRIKNDDNIAIFSICCYLYAEKFEEECIDIIDCIKDDLDICNVFTCYIDTFQWRDAIYLSHDQFIELINKYKCTPNCLWSMFIGNAIKINHPFNADCLHDFIFNWELNKRDFLWSIYINGLPSNDNERIIQLITLYAEGGKLEFNGKQLELLLTLFGWLLTSSNRWLRDYTSKAMVEILKYSFDLCEKILRKFKDVNDPYIIQRLYGIVFGACCKRNDCSLDSFQSLAEYVYDEIFNHEKVYPDILLRDYARLIVERFLYENSSYNERIESSRIKPPYNSDPIPSIEEPPYHKSSSDGGTYKVLSSMCLDGMGWYGDFGRYVFQNALHSFDIDDRLAYNYAIDYIFKNLGYSEDMFGKYDCFLPSYNRDRTIKTERIGKKYQWIAMHNILARVADNCKYRYSFNYSNDEEQFEGPWEPNVRDFDPTLNQCFMKYDGAPYFEYLDEFLNQVVSEDRDVDFSKKENQDQWLETKGVFLQNLKNTLIMSDESGKQWIYLKRFIDTDRSNIKYDKFYEWSKQNAFFMSSDQMTICRNYFEKGCSLLCSEVSSYHERYNIYNREYPWSYSCDKVVKESFVDYSIGTGEYEQVPIDTDLPTLSNINDLLSNLEDCYNTDQDITEGMNQDRVLTLKNFLPKDTVYQKEIMDNVGLILNSTIELLWEGEYDASKYETISICHPCFKLINDMNLRQLDFDGFYCDENGDLAAFDTYLSQNNGGVIVRKDVLDQFLLKSGLELVWFVEAKREIHEDGCTVSKYSTWEGLYNYKDDSIVGDVYLRKHID